MDSIFPVETYENVIRQSNSPALLNVFARTCQRLAGLAESIGRELADEWTRCENKFYQGLEYSFSEMRVSGCRHGYSQIYSSGFGLNETVYLEYDRGRALTWTMISTGDDKCTIANGRPSSNIYMFRNNNSSGGFDHIFCARYEDVIFVARGSSRVSPIKIYNDCNEIIKAKWPVGYLIDDVYQPEALERWFARELGHIEKGRPVKYDFYSWEVALRAHLPELL